MDLSTIFSTDQQLEITGRWFNFGEKARVKIARQNNPKNREAVRRVFAPYREATIGGAHDDTTAVKLLIEVMADSILVGWEGLTEKGQPLPYSKENAVRLLTNLPNFRDWVVTQAQRMENFKDKSMEEDLGNSPDASSGTFNGANI